MLVADVKSAVAPGINPPVVLDHMLTSTTPIGWIPPLAAT